MDYSFDELHKAPIFAIKRHCIIENNTEITTMVYFMGCELNCKCCFNPKCHEPVYEENGITVREGIMVLTPQELYDIVKIDNLYFQNSDGGVCFAGGEPMLHKTFIKDFKETRWMN